MGETTNDFSIANPHPYNTDWLQKLGLMLSSIGAAILLFVWFGGGSFGSGLLYFTLSSIFIGVTIYSLRTYLTIPAGIQNNKVYLNSLTNRSVWGWVVGIILTVFYIQLYWFPESLGYKSGAMGSNIGLIGLFDPLAKFFRGNDAQASQWFVYGTLYSLTIAALGVKFIFKYRHNKYQILRTISVIVAQLALAYFIPEILSSLNYNDVTAASGEYQGWYDADIKNVWPLDYDFFHDWHLDAMQNEAYQPFGMVYLFIGIAMFLIVTPVLTYFVGKRWYCSWVCGCGGLAETAGDPFRQLSSKKMSAWKLERWLIHGVMVWVFLMTAATLYGYITGQSQVFGIELYAYIQKPYGFVIGAAFSGVVGVGFYPLLGNRVWCRFGCPMAAYMGIIQRFKSKFRITTNGGQCISCGNCSTYCEQGIDVRAYAQRGQNIVRASCVGCGVCSAVCPRGVLKLENGPEEDRLNDDPIIIGHKEARINQNVL